MVKDFITLFISLQALKIFGISTLILCIGIICKFITKISVINKETNEDKKREIRDDILRIGPQICLLGLNSHFAMSKLYINKIFKVGGNLEETLIKFIDLYNGLIVIHILLLLATLAFMAKYDEKKTGRGMVIPNVIAWFSLCLSAAIYTFIETL